MYPTLKRFITELKTAHITPDRLNILDGLVDYIRSKSQKGEEILLSFICTHNSRRSHLSQIWAQTMVDHFGISRVHCYSGGTEATAIYPAVPETLIEQGLNVIKLSEGDNPIYAIKHSDNAHPIVAFSKTYDHPYNPKSQFAAIMTCAEADSGCPFVPGAEVRFSIPFSDPKEFDNSPLKKEKYRERSLQIATELYYVFSKCT